ncbi:hypothetical protein ACCT04_37055, partial [Rhizobium ruizarguesonis]
MAAPTIAPSLISSCYSDAATRPSRRTTTRSQRCTSSSSSSRLYGAIQLRRNRGLAGLYLVVA